MRLLLLIIFLLLFNCDCELRGKWEIQTDIKKSIDHYPIIEFGKSNLAILHSYGDTIYTGIYKVIKKDKMLIKIENINEELQVIKCLNDTLILTRFKNVKDTLTYTKSTR